MWRRRAGESDSAALIDRPRVLAASGSARLIVLEAPSGFGKSTIADELVAGAGSVVRVYLAGGDSTSIRLAARLRSACRAIGLVAAADIAVDGDGRVQCLAIAGAIVRSVPGSGWLVVEDVQVLDDEAMAALTALVDAVSRTLRVVVTGRSVRARFAGECRLGEDVLAFSVDETLDLLDRVVGPDEDLASTITRECGGWAAAIGLTVSSAQRGMAIDNVPLRVEDLVRRLLADSSTLDERAIAAIGHLPVISDSIGRVIGVPDLIERIRVTGLPLRSTGHWWRLSDPVRDYLRTLAPISPSDVVAASEVIFAAGDATLAVGLLVGAGRADGACRLLAEMPFVGLDDLDVDGLAAQLQAFDPRVIAAHPRCLAQLARAAEIRVRIDLRSRLLDQLEQVVAGLDDPALHREVEAERVFDLARDSLIEETERRGRALLAITPLSELVTRTRCLGGLGRAIAWRGDAASMSEASRFLAEAVGAARSLGNDIWVADTLCTLGFSVLAARGDFDQAVSRQREGVSLLGRRSRRRAVQQTFLANVLTLLGHLDEAEAAITDARVIGRAHADERILGYAAWEQARIASVRRDADATLRWLGEAERHPGDWMDHPTGSQFLAEAAEFASAVGRNDAATAYLARSEAHAARQGWPEIPLVAAGVLAARFGDPAVAEDLLTRTRLDAYLNLSNQWRITLLLAHARHRRGDISGARSAVVSVHEQLEALGHPEFAALHEPELWPPLTRLLDGNVAPRVRVVVLGRFRVTVDDVEVTLPAGLPTKVVKVLALAGRAVPIDELGEILWPDADTDVTRRRLRNVVARVRATAPILDRSEGLLALVPAAEIDWQHFEREAHSALAAPPERQLAEALTASGHYTGELLPADRFEDWTVLTRERLQRQAVRLLEVTAERADALGDTDRVVAAANAALAIEPFDDSLALLAASALRAAQRYAEAASWTARVANIRRELGLPVPAELDGPRPAG